MCVRMYVSVTLRNVVVTSRRNVASMMRIHTPGYVLGPLLSRSDGDVTTLLLHLRLKMITIKCHALIGMNKNLTKKTLNDFNSQKE